MKRLFFSLAAIIVAGFGVAFTAPTESKFTNSFFEFDNVNYTSNALNIQDVTKWVKVSSIGSCNRTNNKACRIEVLPDYVDGTSLMPTVNIVAHTTLSGSAYVLTANAADIANKN